jgi:hypothetical protein
MGEILIILITTNNIYPILLNLKGHFSNYLMVNIVVTIFYSFGGETI